MEAEALRVILVDDHRLFRNGLARLLSSDGGRRFTVAGEAGSGEEFLELARTMYGSGGSFSHEYDLSPQIVFMDIDMPGMGGAEASRRALELWPEMKIIALSMHGEQEFYLPMVEAGVKGFLLKNSDFDEVARAALAVAGGGTYFTPSLVATLVEALHHMGELPFGESFSEREAEVLPMICEGLSNRQIAESLFISKRTVEKHRANILAKTGCKNTASLVLYAVKHNLVEV